jgi:hypothetical protein
MSAIGTKVVETICDKISELPSKRLWVAIADAGCPDAAASAVYTGINASIKVDDCFITVAQKEMHCVMGTNITEATQRAVTTLKTFCMELSANEFFNVAKSAQARSIPVTAAMAFNGDLAADLTASIKAPKMLAGVKRANVSLSPLFIPAFFRLFSALSGTFSESSPALLFSCCSLIMLSTEDGVSLLLFADTVWQNKILKIINVIINIPVFS